MKANSTGEYAALRGLEAWDGLQRLQAVLHDIRTQPNVFRIAPRILRVEGVHSDILRWLLDPKAPHGLGDRFTTAFVHAVLSACGRTIAQPFEVQEVHREFSTGGGPIDILLRLDRNAGRLFLGIENKIDSPESGDQLARYGERLASRYGADNVALAFLTLDGRAPKTLPKCQVSVARISHRDLAKFLEEAIAATPYKSDDSRGLEIARQYLSAMRSQVMPARESNPDIDAICRELYDKHREAWRAIRRRLPSSRDEAHASLGLRVCQHLKDKQGGEWLYSISPDRHACVFRRSWLELGRYERAPIVGLSQPGDASLETARVHFRLVADRSDADAANTFDYTLRLKVDTTHNPALGKSVVRALSSVHSVPEKKEFSIPLRSTSGLPGVGDNPEDVPDSVVEWYARKMAKVISALDSVFKKD
jgi:hypothetical protein